VSQPPNIYQQKAIEQFLDTIYSTSPFLKRLSLAFPNWYVEPPPSIAQPFHIEDTVTLAANGVLDRNRLCEAKMPDGLCLVIHNFELQAYTTDVTTHEKLSEACLFGRIFWGVKVDNKVSGTRGLVQTAAPNGAFTTAPAANFPAGYFGLLRQYSVLAYRMPPLLVKGGSHAMIELALRAAGGITIPDNGIVLIGSMSGYTLPFQ
jgi:hypothetical protein